VRPSERRWAPSIRYESLLPTDELRQSSDGWTRLARTAAVTREAQSADVGCRERS